MAPVSTAPNMSSDDMSGAMMAVLCPVQSAIQIRPSAIPEPQASYSTHTDPVNSVPPVKSQPQPPPEDNNTTSSSNGSHINLTKACQ